MVELNIDRMCEYNPRLYNHFMTKSQIFELHIHHHTYIYIYIYIYIERERERDITVRIDSLDSEMRYG